MRSLELFSGAGGLALGLERAGFRPVALVERNRDACATLRRNRPKWNVLEGDIREVDFGGLGKVELVAGGPPCQPFSMGGKARGHQDQRDMFPQAARAVRELRPRAFVFENVRGLLRPAFQEYVELILLRLAWPEIVGNGDADPAAELAMFRQHAKARGADAAAYRVSVHAADAADFGVPQRRHRVFFVGFRQDGETGWSFPAPTHSAAALKHAQFGDLSYWSDHRLSPPAPETRAGEGKPGTHRWRTVRDALRGLGPPAAGSALSGHFPQPGARSYPGHTGSPLDAPAKALKAGAHGVPGGENMLAFPDGTVRYFSVRESARIQTFPDDYHFLGSWSESMRQLGNAVPVDLAHAVAASVAKALAKREGNHGSRG